MQCVVLIVEDDKDFLTLLARYLEDNAFCVLKSCSAKEALSIIHKRRVNLVISDVEMTGMSGFDLLKAIKTSKKHSEIPVILMSGKKISEADMIEGYEKGNDDYIIKPFSLPLLLAKIKNILRYRNFCQKENIIKAGELKIYEDQRKILIGTEEVKLTRKEFDLILILVKNERKIFSVAELLDIIWGYDSSRYANPHTVEAHISSLRRKLGNSGKKIKNISGYGYKFER